MLLKSTMISEVFICGMLYVAPQALGRLRAQGRLGAAAAAGPPRGAPALGDQGFPGYGFHLATSRFEFLRSIGSFSLAMHVQ